MTKTILASLTVLALAASGASAATQHKTTHHRHAMKPAAAAATTPAPAMGATPGWTGGPTAADHELYVKNQHDAGLAGKR
jgi:hypothetical protein